MTNDPIARALSAPRARWLACLRPGPPGALRLVCFPPGGAGAAAFLRWRDFLPEEIELWALRLPGREIRASEPFVTDAAVVVERVHAELRGLTPARATFYGHSLGAALAYELARRMAGEGERLPERLILSGRMPPHVGHPEDWGRAEDADLLRHLRTLGGLPPDLLESPAFLAMYLPRIRADYLLNASVCRRDGGPGLNAPITIVNGAADPLIDRAEVEGWARYTRRAYRSVFVTGGHFFATPEHDEFRKLMRSEIEESSKTAPYRTSSRSAFEPPER